MLKAKNLIKRFCHNHSRDIIVLPVSNENLVKCENNKQHTSKIQETKIYVDDKLVHNQYKCLPIQVVYFDKDQMCKITIDV